MNLYIYYRVAVCDAECLKQEVAFLHAQLHEVNNGKFCLKRAVESIDGLDTWMEIYPSVTPEFTALLDKTIALTKISGLIAGTRHAEYFLDSLPCA